MGVRVVVEDEDEDEEESRRKDHGVPPGSLASCPDRE